MATREPDAFEEGLLKLVTDVVGSVATFVATRTQLGKSIFETTDQFRQYLVEAGIHDYRSQRFGPEAWAVLGRDGNVGNPGFVQPRENSWGCEVLGSRNAGSCQCQ